MTACQEIIYNVIVNFYKKYGYSPTLREVTTLSSLSSRSCVWVHLRNLEKLGYIEIVKNKRRGIILKGKV